jgi:hypothetical protein
VDLTAIDWGSVPDWLSGTGTLLALVFAFLAVRAAHSTNVQQGIELEAMQNDRRRAQAQTIAIWMLNPIGGDATVRVCNGSDIPVYGVMAFRAFGDNDEELLWYHHRIHALPPGNTDLELDAQALAELPQNRSGRRDFFQLGIVFRDCGGRTWLRDSVGELIELRSDHRNLYHIPPKRWIEQRERPVLRMLLDHNHEAASDTGNS